MSARRTTKRARVIRFCPVTTLAEYDPALAALDSALIDGGWDRPHFALMRRRGDGKVTGRVVWRRAGESIVWSAKFAYEGRRLDA